MSQLAALARLTVPDPRPDGELLRSFLSQRDESAFAELVRRHGPVVGGVCRRTLPDPADAEDAFQASFLVLVCKADRLTKERTVGPWLYRVAIWTARSLRRKNARRLSRTTPLSDVPADSKREPAIDLDAALLALPEAYRTPLVLCHLNGLSRREAAERLGCPEGTLSTRLARGLIKLRAKLLGRDPLPLFALATVGAVPSSLTAATERAATAFALASLIPTASGPAAALAHGVLRMFWVKKAATVAVAAMVLIGVAGVTVGVAMRGSERAVGQGPVTKPQETSKALIERFPLNDPREIQKEVERTEREIERRQNDASTNNQELAKLNSRLYELKLMAKWYQNPIEIFIQGNDPMTLEKSMNLDMALLRLKQIEERKGFNHPEVIELKSTVEFLKKRGHERTTYRIVERFGLSTATSVTTTHDERMLEQHLTRLFNDKTVSRAIKFACDEQCDWSRLDVAILSARRAGYEYAIVEIPKNADVRLVNAKRKTDDKTQPNLFDVPDLSKLEIGPRENE